MSNTSENEEKEFLESMLQEDNILSNVYTIISLQAAFQDACIYAISSAVYDKQKTFLGIDISNIDLLQGSTARDNKNLMNAVTQLQDIIWKGVNDDNIAENKLKKYNLI